jgi:hypothetical protein
MSGKGVRETLAALGVIASLVFVGAEIRQNTTVARATARQAMADASNALAVSVYTDSEVFQDLGEWRNAREDAVLDCDQTRMCLFALALARHHENVFFQAREGIVDEDVFASYGFSQNVAYLSPYWPQYWPQIRRLFHPDFIAAFEAEYDLAP